ncbi:50S ribosomal protein L30 [candidate division KSB1 bacterium]|nr:50S ribosomal protein L30 [candidate division KSB1 bacterium]
MAKKALKITLKRSIIGYHRKQKATVEALGLKRLHHSVTQKDTPQIRGMINKITHLVEVEEVS